MVNFWIHKAYDFPKKIEIVLKLVLPDRAKDSASKNGVIFDFTTFLTQDIAKRII